MAHQASKQQYEVLDKGFVRLVEQMGGDLAVVLAARVSYGSRPQGEEKDRRLINYLMKHHHETPFEHAVYKFHVKCPLFVARQWFRHRWSSFNEISARYTEFPDEFYRPAQLRVQAPRNKQGSEPAQLENEAELLRLIEQTHQLLYQNYQKLLAAGVARELARGLLPMNSYTQFYWTVNARSLMNFVNLRADEGAQWEMRQYAEALAQIFEQTMPWSWEAFVNFYWSGENPAIKVR
ncbi:MAG TPA: FAD-dependent thymidylate synthase [Candidatus Fraserbacteria bacterium]|mgnify:CR=1 FL=1|nr:FAD-dependent thymidylate synthase [Candidatus Fraserbacteria bacterium]